MSEFRRVAGVLEYHKQQALKQYRSTRQRMQTLLGLLLVEQGMRMFGHDDFSLQQIIYQANGKPVSNCPVKFNISHSGNRVVCVFSDRQDVAIDVEKYRPLRQSLKQRYLDNIDSDRKALQGWTAREAMVKLVDYLSISDIPHMKLHDARISVAGISCYSKLINLSPGYACAIACHKKPRYIQQQAVRFI